MIGFRENEGKNRNSFCPPQKVGKGASISAIYFLVISNNMMNNSVKF